MTDATKLAIEALELAARTSYSETNQATFDAAIAALRAQPDHIVGTKTWFEDGKVVTQNLTYDDVYKAQPEVTHTINKTESLAVAEGYYLQPMSTCPRGVKVQLQGQGGVLVYGIYDGRNKFWKAWAPLPRERKET